VVIGVCVPVCLVVAIVLGLGFGLVRLLGLTLELPELVCPAVPGFELVCGLVGFVLVSLGPGSASRVFV
jgi:hypothetical protein